LGLGSGSSSLASGVGLGVGHVGETPTPPREPQRRPRRFMAPASLGAAPRRSAMAEPRKKKKTLLQHLVSPVSGAGAGVVCTLVCSPLDVLKTRFQVQGAVMRQTGSAAEQESYHGILRTVRTMVMEEGAAGFYRGLTPALVTVPIFWGLYFPTYEGLKATLEARNPGRERLQTHEIILAAMGAGIIVDITTNPLWVVRTRMQTQHLHSRVGDHARDRYKTITGSLRHILATDGVAGLFRGLSASFLGLTHVAVQFPIYEHLKRLSRENNNGKERKIDLVFASAFSKVCGCVVSYPHEVLRARMQDSSKNMSGSSLIRTAGDLVRNEGWQTFYTGLYVNLVRVIPSCVTTFVTYEVLSSNLRTLVEDVELR